MSMDDIRDRLRLGHEDIVRLNFIRNRGCRVFRRHFRSGLRSHILEVLDPRDVEKERQGAQADGLQWFFRARPIRMLRIFRKRFESLSDAREELRKVGHLVAAMGPEYVARSEEFLVDYSHQGRFDMVLCGLQEVVEGEVLDPWGILDPEHLKGLFLRTASAGPAAHEMPAGDWLQRVSRHACTFVRRLRGLCETTSLIPDLAGAGNLLLARSGHIRLVDINNISRVSLSPEIPLDDRGYPVCDKSIQALFLLQERLAQWPVDPSDPLANTFLSPQRMEAVRALVRDFHLKAMTPLNP